jgi:hypothetical protein
MRPLPRRVRGTPLEARRVPWWLARYLTGPARAESGLRADLAEIAARVRRARATQPGPKGSAPRLKPGELPAPAPTSAAPSACDI